MPINGKSKKRDQPNSIFANKSVLICHKNQSSNHDSYKIDLQRNKGKT